MQFVLKGLFSSDRLLSSERLQDERGPSFGPNEGDCVYSAVSFNTADKVGRSPSVSSATRLHSPPSFKLQKVARVFNTRPTLSSGMFDDAYLDVLLTKTGECSHLNS